MAFTQNSMNNVSSGGGSTIKIWSYINTSDSLATIMAASYFNAMRFALRANDVIFIIGSDGSEIIRVTSLVNTTSVTVVTYDTVAAGTITNADVAAGAAIAFSKLATLTSANILVGSAANVPTSVAVTGDVAISNAGVTTIQAVSVENSMIALSIPRTVTVAISAAAFNAAYATPLVLIAAGGANTMHIVQSVVYEVNYGTVQFANGGAVALQYDSTANGAGTAASATVAAAVFNGYTADSTVGADGASASAASTTTVNKGIYLSNATAPFITGDSTLNAHITYSTVTTTV